MPSPYNTIATQLTSEQAAILAAFSDAENTLSSYGAPSKAFLEINWDGVRVLRTWDGSQVSTLPASEQYRLYPQLTGLFNAAMRALLYP